MFYKIRICSTIIFIPRNFIVMMRNRNNIHISIVVHICCWNISCSNCTRSNIPCCKTRSYITIIFIPSNCIIIYRCRNNIHIAITVNIRYINRINSVSTSSNSGWCETRICITIIFVPSNFIVIFRSRNNIHVTITI